MIKHLWLLLPLGLIVLAFIAFYKTQPSATTIIDFIHPLLGIVLIVMAVFVVIGHYL